MFTNNFLIKIILNIIKFKIIFDIIATYKEASMMELVDLGDSKSPAFGRPGSNPGAGTTQNIKILNSILKNKYMV